MAIGDWKSENADQKLENRDWRLENGDKKPENGDWEPENGAPRRGLGDRGASIRAPFPPVLPKTPKGPGPSICID